MTDFTRTGEGALPSVVSNVGGVVLDIIGANGNRLIIQVPATALARVPAGATSVDLATVQLTAEQYAALGGGIREFEVRVTAFDGDSEAQNADGTIVNGFRFNGDLFGDISDNRAQSTSPDGSTVLAEREGFGDGTLDTSWMAFSGAAASQFYNGIDPATRTITITYVDYNGAQDDIDWTAGLDQDQAANAVAPTFVPNATSTGANSGEGGPATITVIASDPADDRALTYAFDLNNDGAIEQTGSSNSFTFTPADEGSYRVQYYVTDADGVVVSRFRIFNIGNSAPTADDDTAMAAEGASVTVDALANDRDPGADVLTITGASVLTGGGSVSVIDNRLQFATDASFDDLGAGESRVVTLSYTISDGDGGTDQATVAITVSGVNDAPTATADEGAVAQDGAVTIAVTANDADVDGDALTVTSASVRGGRGSVAFEGGAITFSAGDAFDALGAGETATVMVDYTVSDGNGGTAASVLTLTVAGANDGPVARADTGATDENGTARIDALANDTDVDGDAPALSSASVRGGRGAVAIEGGQLVFTTTDAFDALAAGQSEEVVIDYTIADGNGGTAASTATVTVTGVNDAPTAAADVAAVAEGGAITVAVTGNDGDVDGDALGVTAASVREGRGSVAPQGGAITFTAGDAFDGLGVGETETVVVDYTIGDGNGGTATSTLTVIVTGTNDGPVARTDTGSTNEDGTARIDALANDMDVDGDGLRLASASVQGGRGAVTIEGGQLVFSAAGAFDALAAGQSEAVVIDYTIADGNGGIAASTATVTVTGVNDAPVVADEAATVAENGRVTVDALANDRDPDAGDRLSLANLSVTGGGSASIVDGRIVYDAGGDFDRLAAGQTATVNIGYDAVDGSGARDAGVATITVTGVNDAPVAADDAGSVRSDGRIALDVVANDSDADGGTLALTGARLVGQDGGRVSVVDGRLVFDTAGQFGDLQVGESVSVEIAYTVSDGQGGTGEGRAVVAVNGFALPTNVINGTNQSDWLRGGDGFADTIYGNAGHDLIEGRAGNDRLFGGTGSDALYGGSGRDVLDGGRGHDLLVGGDGADLFVMGRAAGHDVVLDFEVGTDRVVLDGVRVDRTRLFDVDGDGKADTVLNLSHGGTLVLLGVDQPIPETVLFG